MAKSELETEDITSVPTNYQRMDIIITTRGTQVIRAVDKFIPCLSQPQEGEEVKSDGKNVNAGDPEKRR